MPYDYNGFWSGDSSCEIVRFAKSAVLVKADRYWRGVNDDERRHRDFRRSYETH